MLASQESGADPPAPWLRSSLHELDVREVLHALACLRTTGDGGPEPGGHRELPRFGGRAYAAELAGREHGCCGRGFLISVVNTKTLHMLICIYVGKSCVSVPIRMTGDRGCVGPDQKWI